jgi:putative oxidoreductase
MLPLRLALGMIFVAHGSGKVLGYGGPGLARFTSFPTPFSFMQPTKFWLAAAAFSEFVGGILVLYGLLTRVGAFFIACTMLTAMAGVHWHGGFFLPTGIEFTVALIGMALSLMIAGGGRDSVDELLTSNDARISMTVPGLIGRVIVIGLMVFIIRLAYLDAVIRPASFYACIAAIAIGLLLIVVKYMKRS